jgi:hypothetical protein
LAWSAEVVQIIFHLLRERGVRPHLKTQYRGGGLSTGYLISTCASVSLVHDA